MPQIASNFTYLGKKFLDDRQSFNDITAMTSFSAKNLPEGFIAYVKSEDKYYKFNSTNDFDTQLGYWKEYNGGTGGSSTDEKVKLNNTSESKYLEELIDNFTIEVDTENGVIKAVGLDGLETTVATLNFVKNLDKDIMSYLSSIGNPMAFKGVVADDDELNAIEDMVSGDTYIVQSSASNSDKTMTFIYNGVEFVPMAETSIEVRDFTTEPIDLSTETTGILPKEKIDTGIARVSTTLDKSTYKGSADGVVKQADKLTGLTSTISALNDSVTNSHKHTNKAVLDKIVSNGTSSRLLSDAGTYKEIIIKDTTQPLDENVLWLDITDSTNPILKVFDGTDWVKASGSSSTTGSGSGTSSITVDKVMSDTSTNPVQNKVIKDYVDNKAVTVSTASNNAIETKTDGIYVKKTAVSTDGDNALSEKSNGLYVKDLSGELDKISFAQKTVNEDLDYCHIYTGTQGTSINATANTNIIPLFTDKRTNMEVDSDGYIKLVAGKTYSITTGIVTKSVVNIYVCDKNGNRYSNRGYANPANDYSDSFPSTIIAVTEDMYIGVVPTAAFSLWTDCSYISVIEIGKAITIDPLEYANESQGIEDTPVGHIMACMSNSAPKHYLICDGTEYNISDYPYLADHFKTEFGKVNYFGGDGTTKFAVPDLRAEFLRGTGTATRDTGSGDDVGKHQDPTTHIKIGYDSYYQTFYHGANGTKASSQTDAIHDGVANRDKEYTSTDTVGRSVATTANYDGDAIRTYTSRPTNTSVLYCIKATPTYFMKNTYAGFDETVLFENDEVMTALTQYSLSDSIQKYNYLFVEWSSQHTNTTWTDGNINMCKTAQLIRVSDIKVGAEPKNSESIVASCNYSEDWYYFSNYHFTSNNSFQLDEIYANGFINPRIRKIVGIKTGTTSSENGGSCDCTTYTDSEIHNAVEDIFGGGN